MASLTGMGTVVTASMRALQLGGSGGAFNGGTKRPASSRRRRASSERGRLAGLDECGDILCGVPTQLVALGLVEHRIVVAQVGGQHDVPAAATTALAVGSSRCADTTRDSGTATRTRTSLRDTAGSAATLTAASGTSAASTTRRRDATGSSESN